jgi:hypothetical protein
MGESDECFGEQNVKHPDAALSGLQDYRFTKREDGFNFRREGFFDVRKKIKERKRRIVVE